ncbi:unknown [Firmicutes bacterium CAG:791]|nr:unknown [Firmicutes bacterium CAG:791]
MLKASSELDSDFRPGIRQGVEDIPTAGFFLRRTGKVTFDHCRVRAEDGISLDGREFVREQEIQ